MIAYGLSRQATNEEAAHWARITEALIRDGVPKEQAGQRAAAQVLPGYNTHKYASAADTIDMLLQQIKDK
jgi:hypothetical protein